MSVHPSLAGRGRQLGVGYCLSFRQFFSLSHQLLDITSIEPKKWLYSPFSLAAEMMAMTH